MIVALFRTDTEIQLKCFHNAAEAGQQHTNWPHSVAISVNNRALTIERGEHCSYHKPLHIKNVCVPGKNIITISAGACCCVSSVNKYIIRPTSRLYTAQIN